MKAGISYSGNLKVVAENETELFALKKWLEDSVSFSETEDVLSVCMGSLEITENYIDPELPLYPSDSSFIDHVMEMEKLKNDRKI